MEDELLKVEQVLLLENLTYLADKGVMKSLAQIQKDHGSSTLTVRKIIGDIKIDELDENIDYSTLQNGEDWRKVLEAILADDTLPDMTMIAVKEGSAETGGTAAVFFNDKTGEVVVAFRGTEKFEWKDNFVGGALTSIKAAVEALDQTKTSEPGQEKGAAFISEQDFESMYVDLTTYYQEEALKWYQSLDIPMLTKGAAKTITVTGHSKGGNKAKYITILDDSVTRCLSFDGQGFSDEFFEKYERRIAERAYAITNHNVNFDYVNFLLNDVGERIYYVGYGYGIGKILEAHCPNTFFQYDEEGRAYMVVAEGQAELMMEVDKFLNSYLRTMPDQKKVETLELIGEIAQAYLGVDENGEEERENLVKIIDRMDGWDVAVSLLAYFTQYIALHPELESAFDDMLKEFWPDEAWRYIYSVVKACGTGVSASVPQAEARNWIKAALGSLGSGSKGVDLQIPSVCRPLERNRVFSMNEMLEIGERGRALMQTGSEACMVWDEQLSRLEELLDELPAEVDASALKNTLAQRGGPFYSDEYERMGTIIYNTTHRIVEDMQHYDAEAAKKINEITGNLDAITLNINKLRERIWEPS